MRVNYILLVEKWKKSTKNSKKTAKLWEFYARIEHHGNRRRRH